MEANPITVTEEIVTPLRVAVVNTPEDLAALFAALENATPDDMAALFTPAYADALAFDIRERI